MTNTTEYNMEASWLSEGTFRVFTGCNECQGIQDRTVNKVHVGLIKLSDQESVVLRWCTTCDQVTPHWIKIRKL